MSTARIHGFTAWVNNRLQLDNNNKLQNVMVDLFQNFHWQNLIESITGSPFDKIGSFNGISQIQKSTRIEWILKELISWNILKEETKVDAKLLAARNADETFAFLLKLVHIDIKFLWMRMEFLQLEDCKEISKYKFTIFPERPPPAKQKKFKVKKDLYASFGQASEKYTEIIDENEPSIAKQRIFANEMEILAFKKSPPSDIHSSPKPLKCLLSIIKNHFKISKVGENIKISKLNELCDIQVLCAFVNTLIPHSFSSDILPNDRWSVNLILKALEKVLKIDSDFDAADLNSNDDVAIMVYLSTLFLKLYQFRQSMKVLEYKANIEYQIRFLNLSDEMSPLKNENLEPIENEKNKAEIKLLINELDSLREKFDFKFCENWRIHSQKVLRETLQYLKMKMKDHFEVIQVPKSMSVADICNRYYLHTKNAPCPGYYQMKTIETIIKDRKIILQNRNSNKIITDENGNSKSMVRRILKVSQSNSINLDPEKITNYEVYLDACSKTKLLSINEKYLYQLFPSFPIHWKELLLKFSSSNNVTGMKILAKLFSDDNTFINYQDPNTGNTALHIATLNGYFEAILCLLESGADVNIKNRHNMTPLFFAIETNQERLCGLLLEWGADINLKNSRNLTVLDSCRSGTLREYIERKFISYFELSNSVINCETSILENMVHEHRIKGGLVFISLRSRCLQGSTLLHVATHFSNLPVIKELLILRIDVNIQDYQGASALHRAKDLQIIQMLIEAGADVNLMDSDGNQPLHSVCYGDEEKSQLDKIKILISNGADLVSRNDQLLMPIHCAVMQGRIDVIQLLLESDNLKEIEEALKDEKQSFNTPSLNYLAISGGFLLCHQWLLDHGFNFKEDEPDQLLKNIITGKLVLYGETLNQTLKLLLFNTGVDINKRYPPLFQTALHLAAQLPDCTDLLRFLIDAGADVNSVDMEQCTSLFISCQKNDMYSANLLINNNTNINVKNKVGQTAFDYIPNYIEWIVSGIFDEETVARLKAYNLKSYRNTIRSIDKKINSNLEGNMIRHFRQLESRLDQTLIEDKLDRNQSQFRLRSTAR